MQNKIPIISFFTGGGFLDMGFEQAGFETVFTNEFDKNFAKLYEEGMSSWAKSLNEDKQYTITSTESLISLKPIEILNKAFPYGKPKIWGIIGGPPCQDFTVNGRMDGFNGERGKMTVVFFNRIRKMKPAFFVMENVTGLLHNKISRERLDLIISNNCINDYTISRFVLNALDYGVPQNRERVFVIGIRNKFFNLPFLQNFKSTLFNLNFPIPKPIYENARKKFNWPTQHKFGTNPDRDNSIPIELTVISCLVNPSDVINNVSNIDEYFPLKKNKEEKEAINEGDTKRQSFKRLHRYRYSPTTCYGNNEVHLHPFENRRISVREALRIQGVPDSYTLSEAISMSKKFKMIGNGVPVPMAKAVAESLYQFIKTSLK